LISKNQWHHIASVWSAATKTAKLYIDGSEVSYQRTDAGAGTYRSDASHSKQIGQLPYKGGVQYFKGQLDDIKIHTKALSQEEIQALYTEAPQ